MLPLFIDIIPEFKAGDPRPTGYIAWHAWADVQLKAGLKQARCPQCKRWNFPQEFSDTSVQIEVSTGKSVETIVCQQCANNITRQQELHDMQDSTDKVLADIASERVIQKLKGYDIAHDDRHTSGELLQSAGYLIDPNRFGIVEGHTLSCAVHAMQKHKDRRHQLLIAASLLVAEIERLDRQSPDHGRYDVKGE